jgi:hypothetical protein
MHDSQINQNLDNNIAQLSTGELRQKWSEFWGIQPHRYIRREMLEKSLIFKMRQMSGEGLNSEQQARLNLLVLAYKKNPNFFDETRVSLKPGTRLVRMWKGKKYSVLTLAGGFEYKDHKYTSLSEIAMKITGTRWNGWVFFGLKKKKEVA